ncbi:MAG: hypothetical protein U9Q83_02095 [Bacteroidota bacterium]|nr:hypothetical protein [Bacteroidota bacterium]
MTKKKKEKLIRKHKISVALNDRELVVLNKYLKKYKVTNKNELIRQTLFKHILEEFDKDYPSIFSNTND